MTLAYFAGRKITGTNSDRTGGTWTNLPAGWEFIETDTRLVYYWDGTSWQRFNYLNYPSKGKIGAYYGISATAGAHGIWQGAFSAILVGSGSTSGALRDSTGLYHQWTSGATINSLSGARIVALYTERDYNPITEWQITLNQTTDCRMFFGYLSSATAPVSGADPLNNLSGVLFGIDTGVDGNWHIYQNDGTAGSDSTTINNVAAADTSPHTFALRAVETSSKFQYSYAGGTWTDINTTIPAATTGLTWMWWIENLVASAKTFKVYYAEHFQDK